MSRSAERRKRQEHRAQRRSPGSDSEELLDKLDRLGKRTRAQVEGSARRGFADLGQLPQQLFAEVEGTFGSLDSQPQVREAVGKLTEVMAAAQAMTPLNKEEVEGRKTWIPEDLKDHSEVATRDQQDAQLHEDRMAAIQRAGAGNREQRRWLARREQAERNGKRVDKREGEGGGELSETLAELGLVGFEQGGAAAVAAIHGSLEDMLKAAREAMEPKKQDKAKRPAGDNEVRSESQNDSENEAEHERQERDDEAEQEGNDVDVDGGEGGIEAELKAEMHPAEGGGEKDRDAKLAQLGVRMPLGENGSMELGAGGFSIQGGPGAMRIGPDGLSGSLTTQFGTIQAGPGGTSAAFQLGGGDAHLQIGPGGVQLGMHTQAGDVAIGKDGFSLSTPAGSIAANGNEVSGQIYNLGGFKAQVEPQLDAQTGGGFKAQVELESASASAAPGNTGFGGGINGGLRTKDLPRAQGEPQNQPQNQNGELPQNKGIGAGIGGALREVGQNLAGVVGAAVETLGGAGGGHEDPAHKQPAPVDGAVKIAIDPALAPEKDAKPQVGAARDKDEKKDKKLDGHDKKLDGHDKKLDGHDDKKKLDDPTAKAAQGHGKAAHAQTDHGHAGAHGGHRDGGHGGKSADDSKGSHGATSKKAEGAISTQVEPPPLTGAAHPTAPLQPTAARQAVQRLDDSQRTLKPDGSQAKPDESAAAPARNAERNTMSISTPQRPSPPQQQRMDLPVVPLSPVTRGKGAVTQPDLQITGRGDTPATPSMDGLKEPAQQQPTMPAPATSTGGSEVPKRQQEAAPAPQALPRPEARQAPPPAAATTAGATKIAVKKPGELGLPAGTTPDLKTGDKQHPGAGQRAQVPISSTPVEGQKKTAVPEIPAAKDQTAKPEVAAGTPAAPDIKQPPPAPASGIPNPSEMVQPTVSLSGDRDHAAKQLEAESRTQRKVPIAAESQRRVEVAPLGPERARQVPTIEVPARAQLKATSTKQTATIDNAGTQGVQGAARDGTQHQAHLQQSTAQLRGEIAQRPAPAILGATAGANTTAAPLAQGKAAVQGAVAATNATRPPPNLAVSPAIGQAAAGASFGAVDKSAIAGLDTPRPMPEMDPAAATNANAEMEADHAQNRAMIAQIRDVKPPVINMQPRPVADDEVEVSEEPGEQGQKKQGEGDKASSPQSGQSAQPKPRSRAAAIADIEGQLLQNTQAQLPGQMSAAAGQLASEYEGHADTAFRQNQQNLTTADQQAQQQRAQIMATPPPVNAASVSAEADQLWSAGQQQAQAASADMQQQVAASQQTAAAAVTAATATQAASVAAAQAAQAADNAAAQAAFQSDHQAAQAGFQQQDQQAQSAMQTDQQTAQQTAQTRQTAAQADSTAKQAQAEAQHAADNAAAEASHQADVAAANADSEAEQQRIQSEGDQQVKQQETDLQKQTADLNAKGQQQVDQITRDGEQKYQQRIAEGQREADAKKAEGEREAAAKKAEADSQKGGGGILGKALDWVKARVGELLEAAKAILEAARQAVMAILEAARKAAMAILDAARKAAMDALNAVKEAIQGAIQAVASAIRGIISAVASMVRAAIQALATALQTLVRALTTLLTTLVQVFQKMVNAILDALIAVVSLINEDLGKQLQQATQKYRDAFNNACNTLQTKIQQAGQALEQGIQQAADRAIAVVNQAEQTLNAAVTAVEETLHNAVEAAYQKGVEAINTVYEAAKTAVNAVFDAAVAATNLYFDTMQKGLDVVKTVVDKAIDAAKQAVKDLGTLVSKVAGAIVDMLPSSALKFISDVWNSGWRNAVIIGLATIVAVAVTVGTGGVGGPIAAVLLAGLIGGTLAGGATLAGDALARQATIEMADRGEGIYVPGVGMLKVGPDGQPDLSGVPPDQREQAMKNMQWALSNFDQNSLKAGADGRVTGSGKSHEDIGQMSMDEGAIAFAEGFVSAGLAAVGGLGGTAVANRLVGKVVVDSTIKQMVKHAAISAIVEAPVNVLSSGSTQAVRSGLETIRDGGSWEDAKKAATDSFTAGVMDPATWGSSILAVPGAAAGARVTRSAMSPLFKQASETLLEGGVELVGGGSAAATADYFKALASGASHEEALEKAKKTFTDNFSLENVLVTGGLTVGGKVIEGGVERIRGGGDGGGHDLPTIPREGAPTTTDGGGGTTKPAGGGDRPVVVDNGGNSNGGGTRTETVTVHNPGGTTTVTRPVSTTPGNNNGGGTTTHRPGSTDSGGGSNNVTTRPVNPNDGGNNVTNKPANNNGAPRPNYGNNPTPDGGGTTTRRPGDADTNTAGDPTKPVERPKGDGADAQRPDLDADLDTDAPDVAVGAVKGADVYPVNTRPGKNPGDPPIPVYLNSEKAKRGMKPLGTNNRTFGPTGATASNITHSTTTNASGHQVPQTTMDLNIPGQNGGAPTRVQVEVAFRPPGELASTPAHGDDVGPARFTLTQDSSGNWRASVEVDARTRPEDLQFIVGHELTEISSLVNDNPSGVPDGGFGDQMNAGVMHDGNDPGNPTAHDRAAANEVVSLFNDLNNLQNNNGSPANIAQRQRTLEEAMKSAGLDSSGNIDAKLRLLREAGAPQALIDQVQLGEARRFLDTTLGGNSNLTPEGVQHLLFPADPTGGFANGMNGGHITSRLLDMAGPDTPYAFNEVASADVGGTTVRQFAQFKWKGSGDKPMPGSGKAPGEPGFNPSDWTEAGTPKTTADDAGTYIREVDSAIDTWVAQNGNTIPNDRKFTVTTPSGIKIEGFFEPDLGPNGRPVVRTAYVDAGWLSSQAASQSSSSNTGASTNTGSGTTTSTGNTTTNTNTGTNPNTTGGSNPTGPVNTAPTNTSGSATNNTAGNSNPTAGSTSSLPNMGSIDGGTTPTNSSMGTDHTRQPNFDPTSDVDPFLNAVGGEPDNLPGRRNTDGDIDGDTDGNDGFEGGAPVRPRDPQPNGPDQGGGAVRRPDDASGDMTRDASRDPSRDPARPEPRVPDSPLQNFDATVEQLAHGMVGRDLTDADLAFLEQNGYSAGPIVRGKRDFVMRVFTPTREGVPPIVSFRGTVPSKVQTLIADADPSGIGMYQYNANKDLIAHWMNLAGQHGPIMVAGHSLGGALSQITASNFPDMVQSVRTFQAPGVTRETADKIRQYNEAHPDRPIDSIHHRVEGDLVPRGGETLTPGTVMRYTMHGGNMLQNNVLMRHLASPLSQRERDVNGHKLPTQSDNPDIEFSYDGSISTDQDTKPGGPIETTRRLLGAGLFNTAAAARFLIKLPGGAVRLTAAGARRAGDIITGMFRRGGGDGTRQLPPGDGPDSGPDMDGGGNSPAPRGPRDPNGPSDRDGGNDRSNDRDRDQDQDQDQAASDRDRDRDPNSTANPTMLPSYTRSRNERAREPSPVRLGARSYDVMGITPDGQLQLRPEGVITRNIPVENLYGRTVEMGGEAFTIATITPGGEGGGVNVRLTSVADPRLHVDVTPSQISQINLRFPGGHNMTLGDMSHGVVRLNPPGDLATTTAPLADGQTFEARLTGRELDGVYSIQSHDGGLIATGRGPDGQLRTFPVSPADIAPRYVDVQSANFSTPHQRSSFDAAEDRLKRTAMQTGESGMPISDPLLGTLRDQPNSQVLDGVDSLEVQGNFIRDRATPPGENPTGAGRSMTVFNIVFNGSGEAKRVLEAMVEFRRQNPDAQIQMVVANTQSRPATEQTMADERAMRQLMEDNGIELVLYAGGLQPTSRQGEDRLVIHAKGVMVDNDVMFTTAGVIDPAVKNKVDVSTELPPQAAAAFRRYFDEAVIGNATVEQRQQMAAELAAQGILVNDPVAQLPYIARANDALIGGAQRDLYINTSELKDPAITQKLIDRARAGLEVNILAREFDARSLAMLEAAGAELPNLKFGKPDTWDPRPHYNVIIADGVQAYVGTAYLWPNQQSNLQHARSFENGVLLEGDQVSSLRQQLDAHQARAEGRDGAQTAATTPRREGSLDSGSSVGTDHTRQPSFDPTRDSSLGEVDPFLSAIGGTSDRTPARSDRDNAVTPTTTGREPTVPTAPLANFDATVEQLAHGMVGRDLTDADLAFLAQNGYKAGPIVRGKRDFVMRVFIPTKPGQPPIVSFRGTVPNKVQTLIADADPSGIGMYQFNANKDLISHWMNLAGQHGKIMVAGHSLGGALSQITAANFPDMVQSVRTFQAPGVTRETATKIRDYNEANPDQAIDSVHHRVEGDLVPLGGETLSPGTVMRYTMQGGGFLKNNVLMRHLASPLSQRERDVNGHQLPTQDANPDIEFTYDGSISTDEDTKPGGPTETARRLLGAGLFNTAAAAKFLIKLPGGAVRLTTAGARRAKDIITGMFHRRGADRQLPAGNETSGEGGTFVDAMNGPALDTTRQAQVPTAPLQNFDATVEQLAHGMVGRELTDTDLAFLEQNGYKAGPIVRGERDFVMRVFIPTQEGVPPIVSFRGTVPSKVQTLIADADPSGIGMYQFNANKDLIAHWMGVAHQHGKIMVAGHSLGGALSQIAAAHFPDMVQSVRTFQAPGVTRENAEQIRQYNEAHPEEAIESVHHRVEGDLVPLGGETLTPGTLHRYTMQGGGFGKNNALSRHLASPLSQRERDQNGNKLPVQDDNPEIGFTYDGAISTDDDTKPGGPTEIARKVVGSAVFGTGGVIRRLRQMVGKFVTFASRGKLNAPDPDGDGIPNQELAQGVNDADAAEAKQALARLERAEHAARDLSAAADEELLAAGRRINPSDPRAAVRDAIALEVFRYGSLLGNNAAIVAAAAARLERLHKERAVRRASLHTMSDDHGGDHGQTPHDPFIDSMSGRMDGNGQAGQGPQQPQPN